MSTDHSQTPISLTEAARRLGLSDQVTRLALLRGELSGFKVGRQWRIHPASIDRLMRDKAGDTASGNAVA
jgi:excisionase family DNA binding protein